MFPVAITNLANKDLNFYCSRVIIMQVAMTASALAPAQPASKTFDKTETWIVAAIAAVTSLAIIEFTSPVKAETFSTLSSQYKSYDLQCQNSGTNCWARDEVGERLVHMGAHLCGRRDWYRSAQAATEAGCN